MTPLRDAGLIAAIAFAVLTMHAYRQGKIGNGDLMVRLVVFVVPLLVFSLDPAPLQWTFDELSFRKGGGHRILGATVLAVGILYLFAFSLAGRGERSRRDLTRLIENLALEQFRTTGHPEQFAGGVAVVIPAYNEASNIEHVLAALPASVCGYPLHAIVIDDGSSDDTTDRARAAGAAAVRLPLNRGQGAALRTGYRLALATGAEIVVSMDADGQHQPSELSRLVPPIVDGEADVVNGSRVLGDADPSHAAREMGIRLFAQLLSLLTLEPRHRPRLRLPGGAHRGAARARVPPGPVPQLRVHRRGVEEAPAHDRGAGDGLDPPLRHLKKPPHFRYGMGFANALVRAWLR